MTMLNWHLIERKNMESKILVDTNVLLDYFLTREPFFNDAKQIIEKCAEGKINACIAAHSVSNMFFIQCVVKPLAFSFCRKLVSSLCNGIIFRTQ